MLSLASLEALPPFFVDFMNGATSLLFWSLKSPLSRSIARSSLACRRRNSFADSTLLLAAQPEDHFARNVGKCQVAIRAFHFMLVTIYTHILVFLDYNHLQSFGHGRGPWSECQTSPRKRILEHL